MPPKRTRINQYIKSPQVLLIDENGVRLGVTPTWQALKKAEEAGLDLVEVAPNLNPPVCKIIDFGKMLYEQSKQQSQQLKKNKIRELKEIRLSIKINDHDVATKGKKADQFLAKGHKVKVVVRFKGREIAYPQLGRETMDHFLAKLATSYEKEKEPIIQGKQMILVISPGK